MNSLVRRMKDKSDLQKIHEVLMTTYSAGLCYENFNLEQQPAYVKGRMRDLVELLGLKFDKYGNINWHKVIEGFHV